MRSGNGRPARGPQPLFPRRRRRLARSSRRRRDKAAASVLTRLGKIGADRNAKDAALASLSGPGVKTIEELGFVVSGVNDAPAEGFAFGNDDPPATGAGPVGSAPLSPAMLADQKAREAKYGTVTLAATTLADVTGAPPAPVSPRHRFRAGRASTTPLKAPRSTLCSIRPTI